MRRKYDDDDRVRCRVQNRQMHDSVCKSRGLYFPGRKKRKVEKLRPLLYIFVDRGIAPHTYCVMPGCRHLKLNGCGSGGT